MKYIMKGENSNLKTIQRRFYFLRGILPRNISVISPICILSTEQRLIAPHLNYLLVAQKLILNLTK